MMAAPDHLYFVRAADGVGPVKIGRSASPQKRLNGINTGSPHRLVIAAIAEGWGDYERRFHAMFSGARMHREWFAPTPEMDATISAINTGTFDLTALPPPKDSRRAVPHSVRAMKPIDPTVQAIHARVKAAGIRPTHLMKRAGMRTQTWADWQGGAIPKLNTLRHIERVLDGMISEAERA